MSCTNGTPNYGNKAGCVTHIDSPYRHQNKRTAKQFADVNFVCLIGKEVTEKGLQHGYSSSTKSNHQSIDSCDACVCSNNNKSSDETSLQENKNNESSTLINTLQGKNTVYQKQINKSTTMELLQAAEYGYSHSLQRLLQNEEIDINSTGNNGENALMLVNKDKHKKCCDGLI